MLCISHVFNSKLEQSSAFLTDFLTEDAFSLIVHKFREVTFLSIKFLLFSYPSV